MESLIDVDFSKSKLYLNIDSAPDLPHLEDQTQKTLEYLDKIFGEVIPNITKKGNFTKAIEWCWQQPKDDFFFHLEDDWVINKKVKIGNMLEYFSNDKIFAVNLRAYPFSGPRPCLLPSIYRKRFCLEFIEELSYTRNPERQLREFVAKTNQANVHYPEDINEIILKDIGRHWLLTKGLKRNQISNNFVNYVKG